MGTDQIDIEKKTRQQHQQQQQLEQTLTTAHQFIAVTQKVFLTILLWLRTDLCFIVGTLRLFMFQYAIRKVFEFFFSIVLFFVVPL